MSDTLKEKRYSVLVSSPGDVHNRVAGTKEFVENTLFNMGAPFKWSVSNKNFVPISKMHDNHLINSIKEDINFVDTIEEMTAFLNGALMNEFVNRTDEN